MKLNLKLKKGIKMNSLDAAKKKKIDSNLQEGLILLQNAVEYFRQAHYLGSGMAELLLRRTVFSLFLYDTDRNNRANGTNAKEFLQRKIL